VIASPTQTGTRDSNETVAVPRSAQPLSVGLLTGGGDRHYAFGLAMGLIGQGLQVDFIGGDEVDSPELHQTPGLTFLNLRRKGNQPGFVEKSFRLLAYYWKLVSYAAVARPKVFHILWNNKFETFDRTLLMLYYRLLGKKIVLTAHNVNAGTRDETDSYLNRLTLRVQYRLTDHIFVHTEKMRAELIAGFCVEESKVSVIRYGINNAIPGTGITSADAKARLGLKPEDKAILFFGNVAPYKGLEYLVQAFEFIALSDPSYKLIIAGRAKAGFESYVNSICESLNSPAIRDRVLLRLEFIPDEDTELYFKAADVSVLPYVHIFQSGVLFFSYSFGVPVIAADVGSLREDVIEGKTGYMFRPRDPNDLAIVLQQYFGSDCYKDLPARRCEIRDYIIRRNSWDAVGESTRDVYCRLLRN